MPQPDRRCPSIFYLSITGTQSPASPGIPASDLRRCHLRRKYEVLNLKVVHRRHCTGFEQNRELPLHIDDLIAGRYQASRGYLVPSGE